MSKITKKITNNVFVIIGIQIAIITASFIVLESIESQKVFSSNSVNVSGKNRFFTELTLNAVKDYYIGEKSSGDPISKLVIYEQNLQLLKTGGGTEMGITVSPLPANLQGQWDAIHYLYLEYNSKIQSFVKSNTADQKIQLVEISALADQLVDKNDGLTNSLASENQDLTTTLMLLEVFLAVLNIGVHIVLITLIYTVLKNKAKRLAEMERKMSIDRKYRSLYDGIPDLCRTVDDKGTILDCNVTYATSLGYSREEIIGKSIFDHVSEQSYSDLRDSLDTWKNKGFVKHKQIWFKRKDGTRFPTLISAANLLGENGEKIGSNTVIHDMSDVYNITKELEEQKLMRLSTIGELSARLAHDIKNPLSVIKNTVELIKIKCATTDESTIEYFNRITRSITRISHQIDDVLNFVKSSDLVLQNHMVSEILNDTLDRLVIPDKISIKLPKNDAEIICDADKLQVVFANLITNAIQSMNNEGEIDIDVTDDEPVLITIQDNGSGISDEILPKIFDPLFTTKQHGTGLGLASCKNIVEQHEGKIWATSEIGKGTIMHVALLTKTKICNNRKMSKLPS